jgi:hypothetical protein
MNCMCNCFDSTLVKTIRQFFEIKIPSTRWVSYILISLPVVCRTCYCYIAIEHEVNAGKYKCCKRYKWSKTSTHSMALPLFLTVGASRISAVRPRALPHMETQVFCKQHSQSSVKSIGQAVKSCHLATSLLPGQEIRGLGLWRDSFHPRNQA